MDHIIRKSEEKDIEALIVLCGNHAEYEQIIYSPAHKSELLKNAIFAKKPELHCYVIESNAELVGYFTYTFDFSTWDARTFLYLDCLYLEPDYRGLNIGEKIFEMLKNIADANKCVNIQWQTPASNDRAIKFYNRIGATGKNKTRFIMPL